jgi:hypothetical protein
MLRWLRNHARLRLLAGVSNMFGYQVATLGALIWEPPD